MVSPMWSTTLAAFLFIAAPWAPWGTPGLPGLVPVDGYRVLGLFPFNGRSHNIMFRALMEALAEHGHEVVMLSPFPQKKPRANYTDLDISSEFPSLVNRMTYEQMTGPAVTQAAFGILKVIEEVSGPNLCRKVFANRHFKDVMSGVHGKFDVVFTEVFGTDCWAVVPHKLQLPFICMVSGPDFPWVAERTGSVDNPSYIENTFLPSGRKMDFWQRLENVFAYFWTKYWHQWWIQDPSDVVVREFFGPDTPPISEMLRNTSLVMVNRHESLNPARPVNPNVIHVSGLHLRLQEAKEAKLDAELRAWMDGAEHGVIFFSLGSLVRCDSLPKHKIHALRNAFAKLPQRVLWKFETEGGIEDLPANVRTASWLPQTEILGHPKTILFITHGGLMGTTEAVYLGVPLLGIPLFADQGPNIQLYKSLGVAEHLDHRDLREDVVLDTIKKITTDPSYRHNARSLSARYRDRPHWATEEAVWWTEYVVRHGGAPHLRPIAADMPLYQYLLLDVAAFVVALILVALLLLRVMLRALLRALLGHAPQPQQRKEKRK